MNTYLFYAIIYSIPLVIYFLCTKSLERFMGEEPDQVFGGYDKYGVWREYDSGTAHGVLYDDEHETHTSKGSWLTNGRYRARLGWRKV
jgi:hypothetical protein